MSKHQVHPSKIAAIFDQVVAEISPAFDRSSVHTSETWVHRCAMDLAQLWRWPGFTAITEVQQAKQGWVLHIVAAAGNYSPEYIAEAEEWGESIGCVDVFLTGRRGWAKKLPDYHIETITLRKALNHDSSNCRPGSGGGSGRPVGRRF